jgi:hypothetical protein
MERPKQLTIGETIAALKAAEYDDDAEVRFDFGYFVPTRTESYRGFYDQLALGYCLDDHDASDRQRRNILKTPADVINELQQAIGRAYEGYKGGEYVMHADTPLWVANTGEANGTGVIGVRALGWKVIIETRYVDPDEVTFNPLEVVWAYNRARLT